MGGGGAMRAAAKVAGIGAITTGFRTAGLGENPVTLAARKSARPVSGTVCSGGGDQTGFKVEQAMPRPVWESDDWEFAGVVDDDVYSNSNSNSNDRNGGLVVDRVVAPKQPRVVFGPVPSIEEAKEATHELKDALEKVYLSSPRSSGSAESFSSLHETKACITHESSVPKGAMQAFMLLKESSAAQTVVASIASDPNVWNAVMQNPTLMEFLESDRKYTEFETEDSPKSSVDFDDADEPGKPDGFMGFLEDVKVTVVDYVSSLASFVEGLFAVPDADGKGKAEVETPRSVLAKGSFMALAMMVIMVVVMRRG